MTSYFSESDLVYFHTCLTVKIQHFSYLFKGRGTMRPHLKGLGILLQYYIGNSPLNLKGQPGQSSDNIFVLDVA